MHPPITTRRVNPLRTSRRFGALLAIVSIAAPALAGTAINFTPLPNSATDAPSGSTQEFNSPFLLSPGLTQASLVSRNSPDYLSTMKLGNWDMVTTNETGPDTGRYVFIAHETQNNAGISRYDHWTGQSVNLGFDFNWGSFDGSTWTPWGTVITGEEWAGDGRLFELLNPLADPATTPIQIVERTVIPNVSHEGLKFDALGNLYFVDEDFNGGIYKFVPGKANSNSFVQGQTFVLKDDVAGDGANLGAAAWVPITDALGNPLPGITDPFTITPGDNRPGRTAANDVGASDYYRPEDLEISTLANGNEVLFVSSTSADTVFSIELTGSLTANVREFVSNATIDAATGNAVDAPGDIFENPDNLAIDAFGNIYILEDSGTGDIWYAEDTDNDGVAERIARWASLGVVGAEPTGLYFDPITPGRAYVNVQHPSSGNDNLILLSVPIVGDLNHDGFVGIADLNIILSNWNQTVAPGNLLMGDPTGDGFVGIADLNTVLGNWNAGTPPAADVPEPISAVLFTFSIPVLLRRRA